MPQLDISAFSPQIIWLIITFCLLYVLMARVALPRIGSVLEQRQSRIDENLGMAQNLRNESEVDAKAYDQGMTEAHEQARNAGMKNSILNYQPSSKWRKIEFLRPKLTQLQV